MKKLVVDARENDQLLLYCSLLQSYIKDLFIKVRQIRATVPRLKMSTGTKLMDTTKVSVIVKQFINDNG